MGQRHHVTFSKNYKIAVTAVVYENKVNVWGVLLSEISQRYLNDSICV